MTSVDDDAPERILALIASGVYGPAIDDGIVEMTDRMLAGVSAAEALSAVSGQVAEDLDLPASEVASDLELLFSESVGLSTEAYAVACAKERDFELAKFALSQALKGGPRPPREWSSGSINWMLQDPGPQGDYDPVYVRQIAEANPAWIVTAAERDEHKYRSGGYSRVESKTFEDLHEELQTAFAEHYSGRQDFDFDAMVRMFADDDFYHCHYVARSYLGKIISGHSPAAVPVL